MSIILLNYIANNPSASHAGAGGDPARMDMEGTHHHASPDVSPGAARHSNLGRSPGSIPRVPDGLSLDDVTGTGGPGFNREGAGGETPVY